MRDQQHNPPPRAGEGQTERSEVRVRARFHRTSFIPRHCALTLRSLRSRCPSPAQARERVAMPPAP